MYRNFHLLYARTVGKAARKQAQEMLQSQLLQGQGQQRPADLISSNTDFTNQDFIAADAAALLGSSERRSVGKEEVELSTLSTLLSGGEDDSTLTVTNIPTTSTKTNPSPVPVSESNTESAPAK